MGRFAAWLYDVQSKKFEEGPGKEMRPRLLQHSTGRVLEIGAGTGANLAHYPGGYESLTVTEPDPAMLARARRRASEAGIRGEVMQASAEHLPFADESFDTVACTVVFCTIPDPDAALREVWRVLKPGGQLLFAEHIRSEDPNPAKWQDRLERPWGLIAMGCHPNRDTRARIEAAGFQVEITESGRLPKVPKLVESYIAGRALRPAAASG